MIVPERGLALTALTNSVGGPALTQELFDDDWWIFSRPERQLAAGSSGGDIGEADNDWSAVESRPPVPRGAAEPSASD